MTDEKRRSRDAVKSRDKRDLEESDQETNNGEKTADKWCTSGEGGVTRVTPSTIYSARDRLLSLRARESGVCCGLNVEVSGRVTQTFSNGLKGKFGLMLQSGVKGISSGKLDGGVMDVVLENNESGIQERSVSEDRLEGVERLFPSD